MNCLILDLILQISSNGASTHNFKTKVYGLESNDNITQSIHEAYRGHHWKRTKHAGHDYILDPPNLQALRYQEMVSQVDAVLRVNRFECIVAQQQDYDLQKMWSAYIDGFPRQAWHQDLMSGLSSNVAAPNDKLTVGYVDRQNTVRHLPPTYHTWLVRYFTAHTKIHFLHLHMENYTSLQQIQLAASCDVLIGMHGNGLSHALWMPPNRHVVELYWNDSFFHWDYATLAQLLNHTYLAFQNGRVVDPIRIAQRDASLMSEMEDQASSSSSWNQTSSSSIQKRIQDMKPVLEEFLQNAMTELGI